MIWGRVEKVKLNKTCICCKTKKVPNGKGVYCLRCARKKGK